MTFSQKRVNITANISDSTTNEKIQFATVQLFDNEGSILQYATISDENGIAKIQNIITNNYRIQISCIGYESYTKSIIINSKSDLYIKLKQASYLLNEIDITEINTGTKLKVNKLEFIPDTTSLKNTVTAIDLLRKVPTVNISRADNTIKVNGNKNVLVLIDGNYSTRDIDAIPAEDIEKIEIIDNPSTKYDFSVSSVVNMKIKENRKKGFRVLTTLRNGIINYRGFDNIQLDYDIGKFRFFVSDKFSFNNFKMDYYKFQAYDHHNVAYKIETSTLNSYKNKYFNNTMQYGFDYQPDNNNFLNFTGNFSFNNSLTDYALQSKYFASIIETRISSLNSNNKSKNISQNYTIFYNHKFKKNSELSMNTNFYYGNPKSFIHQIIQNQFIDSINNYYDLNTNQTAKNLSLNSNIDYEIPISKKWTTTFGTQFYWRKTNDIYFNSIDNELFKYSDYRISTYNTTNYNISEKLNLQAGIRIENSFVTLENTEKLNHLSYMPKFSFSYKINDNNLLKLNISKTTIYPDYYYLSSNTFYSLDSTSIRTGNSYLKPIEELKISPQYTLYNSYFYIGFIPSYCLINNSLSTLYIPKSGGVVEEGYFNLEKYQKVGTNIWASVNLFDMVELSAESSLFYNFFDNKTYNGFTYNVLFIADVSLPLDFFINLEYDIYGKEISYGSYWYEKPSFYEITVGKMFLKGRIMTSISLIDFFPKYSEDYYVTKLNNYYSEFSHKYNSRCILFMFRYFFKSGKSLKNRELPLNFEEENTNSRRRL
jgi:hypothetical protein